MPISTHSNPRRPFLLNVFSSLDSVGQSVESRVIRTTTLSEEIVELSVVGFDLKTSNTQEFATMLAQSIESSIKYQYDAEQEHDRMSTKAMESDA